MNSRQPHGLPARPELPSKPVFAAAAGHTAPAAGPSRPRPPVAQRSQYAPPFHTAYAQAAPYQPQQGYGNSAMPLYPQTNLSGGYQPNMSGGYPAYAPPAPYYASALQPGGGMSFGQSLFQQPQLIMNNSYAYPQQIQEYAPRPAAASGNQAKRQRPNHPPAAGAPRGGPSVKAWRNCSHPGCKFVGSGEDVEIHEGDRHLIFPAGKMVERSEEEERYARRKGPPPPIEGTNITLNTPQDIEKWIAERRAKWPSAKRVKEKEEERQAAIARGELPARGKGRRGRGLFGDRDRANEAAFMAEEWGRAPRPQQAREQIAEDGNGRWERGTGRGRGRGRDRGRGRGGHDARSTRDGGWTQAPSEVTPASDPDKKAADTLTRSNDGKTGATKVDAPGLAGLGSYDSASSAMDTSSESDSESESDTETDTSDSEFDASADGQVTTNAKTESTTSPSKPLCKFFAQHGRCKLGDRCQFLHGQAPTPSATPVAQTEERKRSRQPTIKRQNNPFARPSMLGSLLANPIQNTLSQLSQTIRFLAANDFLDGVEAQVGDAEAQLERRGRVVEVEPEQGTVEIKQE